MYHSSDNDKNIQYFFTYYLALHLITTLAFDSLPLGKGLFIAGRPIS